MKRTTKKADSSAADKGPESMDPSIRENRTGSAHVNAKRTCYAIMTLNEEVWSLFPETPVEYSDYDQRNTALTVTYDISSLDVDAEILVALLGLIESDLRVLEVLVDDGSVLVSMRPGARTQDSRAPFGLKAAHEVLEIEDESR